MNGTIIPDTPIAVDFWQIRQKPSIKIFFLSHMHADHTKGLSASWRRCIYCSPVTARLATAKLNIPASLLKPLEIGQSHIIPLDETGQETMTVTLIEANHCPGAIMFLFEGYFGRILYTGDFRYETSMVSESILSHCGTVDKLYLDNTYNMPACVWPGRSECTARIIEIIQRYPAYEVVIGMHKLGKEDMLVDIALALKTRIVVNPDRLKTLKIIKMADVFTLDSSSSRIRIVPQHFVTRKNVDNWQEGSPTIAILPTALYTSVESQPFKDHPDVFVVPYSDHSSYSELVEFVSLIRPRSITPIVGTSRFGLGNGNMSVFDKYLDKQGRGCSSVEIPPSVLAFMNSAKGGDVMLPSRKLKMLPAKRAVTKEPPKGVVFDDAVDEDTNEELERRKKCEHRLKSDAGTDADGESGDFTVNKQSLPNIYKDPSNIDRPCNEELLLAVVQTSYDTTSEQPLPNVDGNSEGSNSVESAQDKKKSTAVAPSNNDSANGTAVYDQDAICNDASVCCRSASSTGNNKSSNGTGNKHGATVIADSVYDNKAPPLDVHVDGNASTASSCSTSQDNREPLPSVYVNQDGPTASTPCETKESSPSAHVDHDASTASTSCNNKKPPFGVCVNHNGPTANTSCDNKKPPPIYHNDSTATSCDNNKPSRSVHVDHDGSTSNTSCDHKKPSTVVHVNHDVPTASTSCDITESSPVVREPSPCVHVDHMDSRATIFCDTKEPSLGIPANHNSSTSIVSLCENKKRSPTANINHVESRATSSVCDNKEVPCSQSDSDHRHQGVNVSKTLITAKAPRSKSKLQSLVFTVKKPDGSKSPGNLGREVKPFKRKRGTDVLSLLRASASKKMVKEDSESDDDVTLLSSSCSSAICNIDNGQLLQSSSSDESCEPSNVTSRIISRSTIHRTTRKKSSLGYRSGNRTTRTRPQNNQEIQKLDNNSPLQDCTRRAENSPNNDMATHVTTSCVARRSASSSGLLVFPYSVRPVNRKRKRGQRRPSFAELFEQFSQK